MNSQPIFDPVYSLDSNPFEPLIDFNLQKKSASLAARAAVGWNDCWGQKLNTCHVVPKKFRITISKFYFLMLFWVGFDVVLKHVNVRLWKQLSLTPHLSSIRHGIQSRTNVLKSVKCRDLWMLIWKHNHALKTGGSILQIVKQRRC